MNCYVCNILHVRTVDCFSIHSAVELINFIFIVSKCLVFNKLFGDTNEVLENKESKTKGKKNEYLHI